MSKVVIPDYPNALVGWRAWRIKSHRDYHVLQSCIFSTTWEGGKRLEAQCLRPTLGTLSLGGPWYEHQAPARGCMCGIYASKSYAHLQSQNYKTVEGNVAIGEVWLWGTVAEGELGWRAQYAYPKNLLVPYEGYRSMIALENRYGIKAKIANTLKPNPE